MARDVYLWPPVNFTASMWTVRQPLQRSRSFFDGGEVTASAEPERRAAQLVVPGVDVTSHNAGYCEVLKKLLKGGQNLIRLNSPSINWHLDEREAYDFRRSSVISWKDGLGSDVSWEDGVGSPVVWLSGEQFPGVTGTDGPWDTVTLTGLTPNVLIARPGEFVKGFNSADDFVSFSTATVLRPAYSDAAGTCVIYLLSPLQYADHVEVDAQESVVFRHNGPLPEAVQPVDGNWFMTWDLIEVFAAEVGGFVEIDPWT